VAAWDAANHYVILTENMGTQYGLLTVPDLDNGAAIGNFTATFNLQIGPGSGNAADGFSFNWGTDVPTSAGTLAWEDGAGTGLSINFDTYDNGGGEAPSIDIKVGGTVIRTKGFAKADMVTLPPGHFVPVKIQYTNGLVSVDFNGQSVYASVPAGIAPQSGAIFGLGGRTGGESEATYIDDLSITTAASTAPVVGALRSDAKGFLVNIIDAPDAAVDANTVTATVDGTAVTGSATKSGDTTTYTFTNPGVYAAGSTHNVVLSYKYGAGATPSTVPLSFTVGAYTTIPASDALAAGVIDPTTAKRGFLWRVHQLDVSPTAANSLVRAENQLAGLMGDNVADPAAVGGADAASTAPNPSTSPITFTVSNVINFKDVPGGSGSIPNDVDFPGIPGTTLSDDSFAGEVVTGIEFPTAGVYHLVVNSDDGFRTSFGKNPRSPTNTVLAFFDGGRGPTDSPFDVYVDTPGIYPMRTVYYEGGGGAALEWYSVQLDGTKILLNDTTTDARALKTYQLPASALPPFITGMSPASTALVRPKTIEATLFDAGTAVIDGSVSLKLNGVTVPITATRTGDQTKIVGTPASDLVAGTVYTGEVTYSDTAGAHTTSWTFTAGPLSTTVFTIEAEDFDYSEDGVTGGLHNPQKGTAGLDVDVMPYYGGAYDGLDAVLNVDYFDNDDPANGGVYRNEDSGNPAGLTHVSIYGNDNVAGGAGLDYPGINSSDRGTYQTTVNYSLGWSGGDWFNYTRDFPDNGKGGWWQVFIGSSFGGNTDPGGISATLSLVTDGVGTTTQTTENLGTFTGRGTGGWGNNDLVPMLTASGAPAVVHLQGLQTVRASISSGDYNFIMLSAANPPPPGIDQVPLDSVKRDAVILDWVLKDGGSQVNAATVTVSFNNQDVTSKAVVTKTATGATIHLDLTGTTYAAGEVPWTITFKDNATTNPQTVTGSGKVVINPYPTTGVFVIEAEDFNYSDDNIGPGGKSNPQAGTPDLDVNVMPYLGGAYNDLSAIPEVDFHGNGPQDGNIYRTEVDPNPDPANPDQVNMVSFSNDLNGRYASDRGTYNTTSNYRIGWAGDNWFNYTRTFPANDYQVWAALSYDGRGADQLRGSLDLVTSDPSKPSQTTQQLGTFDAGASGGWGRNELVPMKVNGAITTVHMAGVETVRFNQPSGDFDYLVFVPQNVGPEAPKFGTVTLNANGSITIQWTGTGTLQTATSVTGPWTDVPGATSPFNYAPPAGEQMRFVRIKQSTP